MTSDSDIDALTLGAYVDGELDAAQAIRVEAWLKLHPEEEAQAIAWQRQKVALKAALDPLLEAPVPRRLTRASLGFPRKNSSTRWMALRVAAALVLMASGIAVGWMLRSSELLGTSGGSVIARALDAHVIFAAEMRHPVEVPSSERDHLNAWLSNRLGHPIKAPDLSPAGYTLLGGRLLSDGGRAVALFMYEDGASSRLTLYVTAREPRQETALQVRERDRLRAVAWTESEFALAVAGDLGSDRLRGIGQLVAASVRTTP